MPDFANINRTSNGWSSSTLRLHLPTSVTVALSVVAPSLPLQRQCPHHRAGGIESELRQALRVRTAERLSLGEMLEEHACLHAHFRAPASRAKRGDQDSMAGIVQMHLRSREQEIEDELRALADVQQQQPSDCGVGSR
jgi:hypothetical protein